MCIRGGRCPVALPGMTVAGMRLPVFKKMFLSFADDEASGMPVIRSWLQAARPRPKHAGKDRQCSTNGLRRHGCLRRGLSANDDFGVTCRQAADFAGIVKTGRVEAG